MMAIGSFGLGSESSLRWLTVALIAALALAALAYAQLVRYRRMIERLNCGLELLAGGNDAPPIDMPVAGPSAMVAHQFNLLAAHIHERRKTDEHGAQLLHTLIDSAPMAILLLVDTGEIEYVNDAARQLFFEGREVGGANFMSLLSEAQPEFRDAVLDVNDSLFTVNTEGNAETYHLSKRHFELRGTSHTLLMVRHLTRELRRQEIDIWKKLIRVLSHELNNSLAPITSLVHSARLMTSGVEASGKLERVFFTIEERARHLQDFVEGYAKFARLPNPRKAHVKIDEFVQHIEGLAPYAKVDANAETGTAYFDRLQMEQVVINLLKNADEAGGPRDAIRLIINTNKSGVATFSVQDRGPGMSEQVLENAMLPFYSTKERGSGLGLALCREIIDAHGGSIKLENRPEGGLSVTCTLPGYEMVETPAPAKLTLSRF